MRVKAHEEPLVGLPMDNVEQIPLGYRAAMSVMNRFYGSF